MIRYCSDTHHCLIYGEEYEVDKKASVIDMYALIDHNHHYLHTFARKEVCEIIFDPLWDNMLKDLFNV